MLSNIDAGDIAIIAGIRRLRMEMDRISVYLPKANEILNSVMDNEIDVQRKHNSLFTLFQSYEFLPEGHLFKNSYFSCIIHMLLTLFMGQVGFQISAKIFKAHAGK